MAFKKVHTIKVGNEVKLEFLHEVIATPLPLESLEIEDDGFRAHHVQNFYELIIFIQGERDIRVEDKVERFLPRDVFAVSPGVPHSARSLPSNLDRYYIHVYPEAFSFLGDGESEVMRIFTEYADRGVNRLTLTQEGLKKLTPLLIKAENELRFGEEGIRDTLALCYVTEILIELSALAKNRSSSEEPIGHLLAILAYIDNSYSDPNVLSHLSERFGISRTGIWRAFKKRMLTTPSDYLLRVRLNASLSMLMDDISITDIAMLCGFSDTSHFIKKFKMAYGVTPRAYRESRRTAGEVSAKE